MPVSDDKKEGEDDEDDDIDAKLAKKHKWSLSTRSPPRPIGCPPPLPHSHNSPPVASFAGLWIPTALSMQPRCGRLRPHPPYHRRFENMLVHLYPIYIQRCKHRPSVSAYYFFSASSSVLKLSIASIHCNSQCFPENKQIPDNNF